MKFIRFLVYAAGVAAISVQTTMLSAATMMTPLATFGNGDGFRAPNEIVVGDLAGTATGPNYNYLQTGALERGLAYNPITDNLVLVSRSSAGQGIRRLNGATGADVGAVVQPAPGVITGGTFLINMVGVAEDGAVYVGNLQTNVGSAAFKVYRWASESSVMDGTPFFGGTIPGFVGGTPRLGDSLDVIGSGPDTTLVAGASGVIGYAVIKSGVATAVPSFAGTAPLPTAGDFRLGITFAQSANNVWGKQTSQAMEETSYLGSVGTSFGPVALTSAGEAAMDYAVIGGRPVLAVAEMNTTVAGLPTIRIYDVTNPVLPVLMASGSTASGLLPAAPPINNNANGNGTGAVAWGKRLGPGSRVLYAMVTNQGIQAFAVSNIPEPTSAVLLLASAAVLVVRRRSRR